MSLENLNIQELQELLMDETKKLTSAIRKGLPMMERDELRIRIQEIQRLLAENSEDKKESTSNRK